MRRILLAFIVSLLPLAAQAQVPPSQWTQNYIPTLTDWQAAFAAEANAFVIAVRGTFARTLSEFMGDMPGPASYLTTGQTEAELISGAIDASPAINAALATGSVTLPCGNYKLGEPLIFTTDNQAIRGMGQCTKLMTTFLGGDVIYAQARSYSTVRDLQIEADVVRTTGATIDFIGTFHGKVDNVMLTVANGGLHHHGIELQTANTTRISDVEMRGGNGDGYYLTGPGNAPTEDAYITNSNTSGFLHGMEIDSASGINLWGLDLLSSTGDGFLVDPTATGTNVNALYAHNVYADSGQNNGWDFIGTQPITEIRLSSCWGSGNGQNPIGTPSVPASGFRFANANLQDMTIEDAEAHYNAGHGFDFESGLDITVSSSHANENGALGTHVYSGFFLNTGVSYITLIGNHAGQAGYYSAVSGKTNQQIYGYFVAPASGQTTTGAYVTLIGNQSLNNATAGLSVPTGPNVVSLGNSGN